MIWAPSEQISRVVDRKDFKLYVRLTFLFQTCKITCMKKKNEEYVNKETQF